MILQGDGGVGKTAFIKRHLTGCFQSRYLRNPPPPPLSSPFTHPPAATDGVDVFPVTFHTTRGDKITFNVWDCSSRNYNVRDDH